MSTQVEKVQPKEAMKNESISKIMARFWYSCALLCAAAFLVPLLTPEESPGLQLGVTFFACAVMVWTFVAAWFCCSNPLADGKDGNEVLDVSRNVLQRVAQGFADFIVENSRREDKSGGEAASSLRSLDFAKFEELVAVAPAAAASALYGYKGTSPKEIFSSCGCEAVNGKGCSCSKGLSESQLPQLDAPHLSLFKELLRDRLVANLMSEGEDFKSKLRLPWFAAKGPGVEPGLEDVLETLLQEEVQEIETRKEDMPFAASMAEHARAIGDKCVKEQQFGAAVHCYEVATLLYPTGPSCVEQLASCHCNCASACLQLRRYGDAVSECHAALVLMPSLSLTMRALQRLAAAHICLRNYWAASRCLQNCLDLEPGNICLQRLRERVQMEGQEAVDGEHSCLVWVDISLPEVRDKRKRRGKQKRGLTEDRILDREAGIWHSMVAHNSRLYIFGGATKDADTGSEEFHILDLETSEVFQPSSKQVQGFCHTATVLENNMLVYGGSVEGLLVFDFAAAKWRSQPCLGSPARRQGHSASADGSKLYIFGGIELMEQQNGRVCNDAYLLDTTTWAWKKLECAGTIPPARFGHTATKLPSSDSLLIVGGRDQMTSSRHLVHDHSGLHLLDLSKQSWSEQPFSGRCPQKAFGHFACIWNERSLLLLSGEAEGKEAQVELFLLDLESFSWSRPVVQGLPPCARLGHAVAVVDDRLYLFGGLTLRGEDAVLDKTVYVLESSLKVKEEAKEENEEETEDAEVPESEEELSFEQLLEQEKAFFKLQSKKASFPRHEQRRKEKDKDGKDKDNKENRSKKTGKVAQSGA